MKTYKSITKEKGLDIIGYQNKFFGKKIWENSINPLVLAAGTSAGKTITSLISLEIFYSNPKNYNKRTLVVPASKTVLRDNYSIELEKFNPSFGYFVATNKKELEEAINDKSYQVIIALPQTISRNYKLLPRVYNFILDEAHQWYFKTTIQTIVKHIKPNKQLLLTGTPSRFIAKGNQFEFFFVPVMDLFDENRVSNLKVEVVSSSYDFKQKDYLSNYGNLKADKTNSAKQAKDALSMVCDEMILKLKSRLGNKYLSNLRGANKVSSLFNDLDKTIIFCHSVKQSNAFFKELNSMKGLKDKVLLSHSDNDKDSEYFEMFRTQSEYKVLVAVDRGRLGYNLPDLFNVVDFTLTQSLDMILQMMGRVLRISDKKNEKIYFKVATKNTAGYFVDLMTAALCLFEMKWYSKYNGKNMGGIEIPKVLTKTTKRGQKSNQTKNSKKGTPQLRSLEELGIPLDLNLFRQDILYSQSDKFGTIAWTTLEDVRREFFGVKGTNQFTTNFISYDDAKKYCIKNKILTSTHYFSLYKENKLPKFLPASPEQVYKTEWKNWPEFLNNKNTKKTFLSFDESKKFIKKLKLTSQREFIAYSKNNRPDYIPSNPRRVYKTEWKGWADFLGYKRIANIHKTFLDFKTAKKILKKQNLKNQKEFTEWIKNNKHFNIHSAPGKYYKEYISLNDFLGK